VQGIRGRANAVEREEKGVDGHRGAGG
jgi:hypothetical protein